MAVVLAGCGGAWIDDDGNFNRIFHYDKPSEVTVIHSYYSKSLRVDNIYFIALQASPTFVGSQTRSEVMVVETVKFALDACDNKRPPWFLPKPLSNYEAWMPKGAPGYRVFRDQVDGTLFLCSQRL